MSDWLPVLCGGVKVGYSLLLGHVANPLTLAWILLADPFSSSSTLLSLTVEASRTRLPVSECTGSPETLSHSGNAQTVARPFPPLLPNTTLQMRSCPQSSVLVTTNHHHGCRPRVCRGE